MKNVNTTRIRKGNLTFYIDDDYVSLRDFILTVPRIFGRHEGELLHEGRNEVRRFSVGELDLVVKRYKRVNLVQRVVYTFFRKSKAERAYKYAHTFRNCGIDTPHEVAYIEQREHGLFVTGYFVSLSCPHPPVFHKLCEQQPFDVRLAEAVTRQILEMHKQGILHGDLNFGNFLYDVKDDGSVHFTVIDINRSRFCKGMPPREKCLKNLCTTTHRRDVYEYIVRYYARLRGWNEEEALGEALGYLERLEERNRKKDQLKNKLKK